MNTHRPRSLLARAKRFLGPGFITGASDDDPSGIATYTQTGAQFGLQQSWLALFSWPLMSAVQEACGRIGMTTGRGLAANLSRAYSKRFSVPLVGLLLLANLVNIGANLGAMGAVMNLLVPGTIGAYIIGFVALSTALQIFLPYRRYAGILQFLSLSLLAYFGVAAVVVTDWPLVFYSLSTPHFSVDTPFLLNIVAFLGTTISPYLFFWQAGQEVEEKIVQRSIPRFGIAPRLQPRDTKSLLRETLFGMGFSNLVALAIVISAAFTLQQNGITTITTAAQAAEALRPLAGSATFILFSIGIIGTGLLSIPVLAGSAAYALAELFQWKEGLYLPFTKAKPFYLTILLLVSMGALINLLPIPPFRLLYYAAIVNGIASPLLLIAVLKISTSKKIMGKHTNTPLSTALITFSIVTLSILILFLFANLLLNG